MAASASLDHLRGALAGLRRRIWALFLAHGLARAVFALCVALVAFYAADVLLDLPLGVRRFVRLGLVGSPGLLPFGLALPLGAVLWLLAMVLTRGGRGAAGFVAFLGGGMVAWLGYWGWRALRPLTARLPDEELVLAVERRLPALQDRLASALDFARELEAPGRRESAPMMQAVVAEAARASSQVPFGRTLSALTTRAWVGTAAAALALVVGVVALDPASAALFARRSLLGQDVRWPRASEVLAVALAEDGAVAPWDPERPFQVAVGRSLVVNALVRGKAPQEVLLLDLAEGQLPLPRRMFAVVGRPGLYAVELTNVRQGFRFVLRAGDDDDDLPVYRVEASVPPSVLEIGAELAFPAYLGRPGERVQGGNLAVPQGTEVRVTFSASTPLRQARAVVGDTVVPAERLAADGGGEAWSFGFTAQRPLRYRLLLTSAEGRQNEPGADGYDVAVDEDRAPRLDWLWPRGSVDVTPEGRVPLLLRALDDHAVSGLTLEVRLGSEGEPQGVTLTPRGAETGLAALVRRDGRLEVEALDGPLSRPQVLVYVALDLAALAPPGGFSLPASVAVRAVALDSKGQRKEGAWQAIEVSGAPELERSLATRRAALRSTVEALAVEQKARREQVRSLVGGPLGEAELDQLKSVQFAQGRIQQHAERAVRDYLDIFSSYVLDRLGSLNPNERILALLDRHHRTTFGQAAGSPAGDDPVFPYALYAQVVEAWRSKALFDTGVLDRMCAVLAESVDVAVRLAPAAHAAAVRASAGAAATLTALLAAQEAHEAALERMLGAMTSWESLSDVILKLRRVLEEQKGLLEQLDQDLNASDPRKRPPAPAPAGPPGGR